MRSRRTMFDPLIPTPLFPQNVVRHMQEQITKRGVFVKKVICRPVWIALGTVILAAFTTVLTFGSEPEMKDEARRTFVAQYQLLTDPNKKRDLVIGAIDNNVIRRGLPLSVVKAFFGVDLQMQGRDKDGILSATVFFEPVIPAPPLTSPVPEGGYMRLSFSSG